MDQALLKNTLDLTVILLIFSVLTVLSGCMPKALKNEARYLKSYYQHHEKPQPVITQNDKVQINSVEVGNKNKPTVILIHGTPGSWAFFSSFLHHSQLLSHARVISVDRPGWGLSYFDEGIERTYTLQEQAQYLGPWICKKAQYSTNGKVLLVGHSYGATLAPKLAMDYPDCISALLLLAGPADPDLSQPRWYNRLTNTKVFGSIIKTFAPNLKKSNKEMMNLSPDLKLIENQWQNITLPTTVIQGRKDFLVNHKNVDFIEQHMINAPLKVIRKSQQGHFVLFENKDLVVNEVIELLDKLH